MSRLWNGLDLADEFAAELSDTSTAGKTRALLYINDIIADICSRANWSFLMKQGKKSLTASSFYQSLLISAPTAPTATISVGGSLTDSSVYIVKVTYYESISGLESFAGVASSSCTATAANKTITLTEIPTSSDPLVTARKLYLSKDGGEYYYHSTISNNTATTGSISTETSSTIEAPDYSQIGMIVGNPTLSGQYQLSYRAYDQILAMYPSLDSVGSPSMWCDAGQDAAFIYPLAASGDVLQFNYKRQPSPLYYSADSTPEIPRNFKELLRAGVRVRGYFYSDRDGKVEQKNIYEGLMQEMLSTNLRSASGVFRVRDVNGDSDGFEV